jgi:hypothetical protein
MHRLVLAVLALVGCSHSAQTAPTAPAPTPAASSSTSHDGFAPQLFTLDQLRAGNAPGRVLELRVEIDGKPATIQRLEFTAATSDEATFHATVRDEAGNVIGDDTGTSKWAELHKHAQFPAADTTIEDNVEVTVPAGTFKTRLYTVKAGDAVRRFWFATDLPGPPVQFTTEKAGKVVQRAQMLRAR